MTINYDINYGFPVVSAESTENSQGRVGKRSHNGISEIDQQAKHLGNTSRCSILIIIIFC